MPMSWMCKKQTSISHGSTETEIFSLDASLRMDGIPALTFWNLVIEIFHSVPNKIEQPKREPRVNPSAVVKPNMDNPIQCKHTNVIPTNIDNVPSNTKNSDFHAMLDVFEDNEAAIKMIIKGRSPAMKKLMILSKSFVSLMSTTNFFFLRLDHFIQLLNTSSVIIGLELVFSNLCLTVSENLLSLSLQKNPNLFTFRIVSLNFLNTRNL